MSLSRDTAQNETASGCTSHNGGLKRLSSESRTSPAILCMDNGSTVREGVRKEIPSSSPDIFCRDNGSMMREGVHRLILVEPWEVHLIPCRDDASIVREGIFMEKASTEQWCAAHLICFAGTTAA